MDSYVHVKRDGLYKQEGEHPLRKKKREMREKSDETRGREAQSKPVARYGPKRSKSSSTCFGTVLRDGSTEDGKICSPGRRRLMLWFRFNASIMKARTTRANSGHDGRALEEATSS